MCKIFIWRIFHILLSQILLSLYWLCFWFAMSLVHQISTWIITNAALPICLTKYVAQQIFAYLKLGEVHDVEFSTLLRFIFSAYDLILDWNFAIRCSPDGAISPELSFLDAICNDFAFFLQAKESKFPFIRQYWTSRADESEVQQRTSSDRSLQKC